MAISDFPNLPPLDGSLTIPEALDFHLKHNSNRPIYVYNNEDQPQKTTEISYLEFARACERAAHVLRPNRAGKDAEVVGVVAHVDTIVYQAITVGLMRAGLVAFPISPRNSPPAIANLLKKTSCHRLIVTQETLHGLTDEIKSELAQEDPGFELRFEEAPTVHQLYPKLGAETLNDPFQPYPRPKQRPTSTDVALYFHSSGSTGFPKPIPETHLAFHEWAALSIQTFREYRPRLRIGGMALPSFHIMGFYVQVLHTLYGALCVSVHPPVLTPKSQPMIPTSDNTIDHLRRTRSNALIIIPTLLQGWERPDEAIQLLRDCEYVGFGGGPLPKELGQALVSAGVRLQTLYGATEFGAPTVPRLGRRSDTDWEWMQFSPRACISWADQGDGTYEARFMTVETHHPSVENMQDLRGYSTSDVFEKHPTRENLWKIIGRKDDVIIHSSGEKTVPGPMESMILSSSVVKGAVIFGREHDQAGLLLEPMPNHQIDMNDREQLAKLRNQVWSVIEEANKNAPAFSRIFKEMILVTSTEKPLPRSGKGSVMRKLTLKLYQEEIEALYKTVESNADVEDVVPPETWEMSTVSKWLLEQAQDILPGNLSPSRDLFEQGFDSLSATFLRLRIVGALRSSHDLAKTAVSISQNTVYTYPTIERLASFITSFIANPATSTNLGCGTAAIEEMIAKYSVGLDAKIPRSKSKDMVQAGPVILITGTTGNLGSQVLASLLQDSAVQRVYALNRPSGSATLHERHQARFTDKCLDSRLLESEKLGLIGGDAADDRFGLSQDIYDELRNTVTIIIHIAWRLDFNLGLSSFEPNVRGTRNLIDLARSSPHASTIRFVFTSSIASAQSWGTERGRYPEELVDDASFALGGGYGEGKYVAERILNKSGLNACSLRVGQISGGLPNGAWATSDWVPIFVKSSLALGVLPDASGVASWIPMDAASNIVLDIAFTNEPPPFALNLAHPHPVLWSHLMQLLRCALLKTRNLPPGSLSVIPFQAWVSRLEAHAKTAMEAEFQRTPALKLLNFFESMARGDNNIREAGGQEMESGGLATFETEKTQGISQTMKEMQPISEGDVALWVKYWDDLGFFD